MIIIEMIELAVAITAVAVAIYTIRREYENVASQLRYSYFADYAKRYSQIMEEMPADVFLPGDTDLIEMTEDHYKAMSRYFDLCCEEHFLNTKGRIDPSVWDDWKEGIETNMSKAVFKKAWKEMEKNYTGESFIAFMRGQIIS